MKPHYLFIAAAALLVAAVNTANAQVVWDGVPGAPPSFTVGHPVWGQGYPGYRILPGVVLPGASENRPWLQALPNSPYFYPAQIMGTTDGGLVGTPTIDPRFWAGGYNYSPNYRMAFPGSPYGLGAYGAQVTAVDDLINRIQAVAVAAAANNPALGALNDAAKNKAPANGIAFAGDEPKQPAVPAQNPPNIKPAGQEPVDPGFKQTIDEINKLFRAQADLVGGIGAMRHGYGAYGPYSTGYPYGYPPNAPRAIYDGSTVVMNGRTGLELVLIAPEVLDALKLPRDQGLLVKEVYPKTPAEGAGFKKGDILVEFNGKKVPADFQLFVTKIMPTVKSDVPVTSVVLRGKDRVELSPMTITEKRVLPPLPHERIADLTSLIQVVPGINTENPNAPVTPGTNRLPELRIIRNGLVTEIIRVDPNQK